MTAADLIADLARRGIHLWAEGDRLRFRAPEGAMTDAVREQVVGRKAELLESLRRPPAGGDAAFRLVPDPEHRHDPFPLTDIQQAYWVGRSDAMELGSVGCHAYFEFEKADLDPERLGAAWRRLVDAHEMLRAVVLPDGRQRILPEVPAYELEVADLRGRSDEEVEAHLESTRERMAHQVFAPDRWPLFEIRATRSDRHGVRVHFSIDLLLTDAFTVFLLFRQWGELYRDPAAPFAAPEVSFRDYVLAETAARKSEEYRRAQEYWVERVPTLPPAPELPLARDPSKLAFAEFGRRRARLEPAAWRRFKERAAAEGLTPTGMLMAAFSEVLATWSKNPRFTLNVTLFNRLPLHPQVGEVVGEFTGTVLLEVDHSGEAPLAERARRVQEQMWRDMDHARMSGVRVLREMARAQGGGPRAAMPVVFTSLLSVSGRGGEPFPFAWLGEVVHAISQTPQVWLDHQVFEEEGALVYNWDTVENVFPAGMLDEMFAGYARLVEELAADGAAWGRSTHGLVPAEQLALRAEVNATGAPVPGGLLHTRFHERAAEAPERVAVIAPERTLTYGELAERANRLARRLRGMGARPDTLVAVVMEKGWEQVVGVLGILGSGAAYLPIDPALPAERVAYLLRKGEVEVAVTTAAADAAVAWPEDVRRVCVDDAGLDALDASPLEPAQRPEQLAYVIFTSGSTGEPKGVMTDHRGAVNTIVDVNERFGIRADDRALALSSLSFDLSVYDIFGLLAVGGAVVVPAAGGTRDPAHWVDLVRRERVTVWNSVPALMEMLVEHLGGRPELRPESLRVVMMSGDWIPVSLPDQVRALADGAQVVGMGGATEASIWSILYPIGEVSPDWPSIPYGRPMKNQTFYVLDHALEHCPLWVPGDLYIGGIGLALGYWRDEEKTRSGFVTHPRTGERLYRTGDTGRYLPDGNIEFLGREDFQVKVRGHRIELGEIEAALLQHPEVRAAVVAPVGPRRSARRLVAHVVPRPRDEAALAEAEGGMDGERLWSAAVEAGRAAVEATPLEWDAEGFTGYMEVLDRLSVDYVARALRTLGAFAAAGERHAAAALLERLEIQPRYARWLDRSLAMLAQEGFLRRDGDAWESVRALPDTSAEAIRAAVQPRLDEALRRVEARSGPEGLDFFHRELDFVQRAGEGLPEALTGRVHAVQFLFPEGEAAEAETLYQKAFHHCNQAARGVVAERVRALPADRTVRVLEVGAGVGSTTAYLLPELPAGRTVYTYTDISRYFLNLGRKSFEAFPFLEFGLLDVEASPREQGYPAHAYDVIVASSVLHATRDIAETLENLRTLLAPDGLLVLIEETRFHRFFDMTMGLQQGFDRFEDHALRPHHPLLTGEAWCRVLREHGFVECATFNERGSVADFLGFDVVVAQAPHAVERRLEDELPRFLAQKLPEYMVPSAYVLHESLPLTANGKVNRQALPEPEEAQLRAGGVRELPRTEAEQKIAEIWSEVLEMESVGVHDNFFEIGGDSLLMVRVQSRLREELGRDLPTTDLFAHPTVRSLAAFLGREPAAGPAGEDRRDRADARREMIRRRAGRRPALAGGE